MKNDTKALSIVTYIFLIVLQLFLGVANFFTAYTYLVLGGISYSFVILAIIHFVSLITNVVSIIICIVGIVRTNKDSASPKVLNGFSTCLLVPLIADFVDVGFLLFSTIMSIATSGSTPSLNTVLIAEIIAVSICVLIIILLLISLNLNKTHQLMVKKMTLIISAIILVALSAISMIGKSLNLFLVIALILQIIVYLLLIISTALFKYNDEAVIETNSKTTKNHERKTIHVTKEQMALIKQIEQLEANGAISPDEALKKKLEIANRK